MMRRSSAVCGDGTQFVEHKHVFPVALFSARFWQHLAVLGVLLSATGAGGAKISHRFIRYRHAAAGRLHADDTFTVDRREHDAA